MGALRSAALWALVGGWSGLAAATPVATVPLQAVVLPAESALGRSSFPVGGAVMHLRAARGEREPAIVVVHSTRDSLLTAQATALFSDSGAALPRQVVELDRIEDVVVGSRRVPDRLEPLRGPEPMDAGENLLLWVEVAVPRNAAPGYYHGELQFSTGIASRIVPIEIEVLPFSLPQTPSLATSFGLGHQSGPVGAFARVALQERVTLRTLTPPPFRVTPLEGTLQLDFSAFDRELGALLEQGTPGLSSIEVLVPASVPTPRRLEYLLAVKRHLTERGCGDLLVNFSEEGSLLRRVQGSSAVTGAGRSARGSRPSRRR